jgi:hypothetical protein
MVTASKTFGTSDGSVAREGGLPFPASQAATPQKTCCAFPGGKCPPSPADWATPTWQSLTFAMTDPHLFRYEYQSSVTGTTAVFTARAIGDLDCDGHDETYEMAGVVEHVTAAAPPVAAAEGADGSGSGNNGNAYAYGKNK